MPAMLDDPSAPTIYRTSGPAPFPDPHDANPALPLDVFPRQVTLRDRITIATIVPFSSRHQVPPSLLAYLADQLNKEIEGGDTYPMIERFTPKVILLSQSTCSCIWRSTSSVTLELALLTRA